MREFARRGADVAVLARNAEALEEAREEVESLARRALALPTDMADADAVERATHEVESRLGPIDVCVDNAMVTIFSPVALSRPEEVERTLVVVAGTAQAEESQHLIVDEVGPEEAAPLPGGGFSRHGRPASLGTI